MLHRALVILDGIEQGTHIEIILPRLGHFFDEVLVVIFLGFFGILPDEINL